jgi:hypothetical protein
MSTLGTDRLRCLPQTFPLLRVDGQCCSGAGPSQFVESPGGISPPGAPRSRRSSSVGAVYGEMTTTIMRSEGDPPASRWRLGAGREALLVRCRIGHGTPARRDQVQFEITRVPTLAALLYLILTKAGVG